jgi:hypothetical protein
MSEVSIPSNPEAPDEGVAPIQLSVKSLWKSTKNQPFFLPCSLPLFFFSFWWKIALKRVSIASAGVEHDLRVKQSKNGIVLGNRSAG